MSEILDAPSSNFNEDEISFMPVVQKYGLILAGISIIMTILMSLVGGGMMALILFGLVTLVVQVVVLVLSVKEHKNDQLKGFISFKRAFLVCLFISLLSLVIGTVFSFIYMNYINPNFVETMKESMTEFMEKYNTPESEVEKALAQFDEMKSVSGNLKGFGKGILGAAIFSAIIAAIMKKERPFFNK
jgi:Protein of unknown function (DUF4199)